MAEEKTNSTEEQTQSQTTVEEPDKTQSALDKPNDKSGSTEGKTFTQADIDRILKERLDREKSKQAETADRLKKLEEYEAAEEERKKAEMSEAERLKAEKEEASKKAEEASESAKKATEAANKRILDSEIRSIARSLHANDVNDVLVLIDREGVEIDDDGNVKGVEDAVKALKESKPWNFKAPVGADASGGSNPQKTHDGTEIAAKEKELADAQEKALKDNRFMGKVTQLYNELLSLKSKQ